MTSRRSLLLLAMGSPLLAAWGKALAQDAAQNAAKPFKPEELDQILAPIALYPDAVLAQTLMAASYPLEVVDAARWSKANPTLKGDAAVAAVKDKTWDVSVKSLTAFPQVLVQMSDHLDWMQKVGDAMIAQQQDVADSVQRLRARAADAGNLKSGKEQTVTSAGTGQDRTIVIEPANPDVVYVPAYPSSVYGTWPNAAYPPTYYPPPPGYGYGTALMQGLLFGVGIAATSALFSSWNWGRGNSYVNINTNRAVNIDRTYNTANIRNGAWQHDAVHRKGVTYRDPATRERFAPNRPGADQRQQFRGQLDQRPGAGAGVQRPQANARPNLPHPNAGQQHPAVANHPNVANRVGGGGGGGGQHPNLPQRGGGGGGGGGGRGGALSGVNHGQQVNREAARGRAQQAKANGHTASGARAAAGNRGGGGGGARGGRR